MASTEKSSLRPTSPIKWSPSLASVTCCSCHRIFNSQDCQPALILSCKHKVCESCVELSAQKSAREIRCFFLPEDQGVASLFQPHISRTISGDERGFFYSFLVALKNRIRLPSCPRHNLPCNSICNSHRGSLICATCAAESHSDCRNGVIRGLREHLSALQVQYPDLTHLTVALGETGAARGFVLRNIDNLKFKTETMCVDFNSTNFSHIFERPGEFLFRLSNDKLVISSLKMGVLAHIIYRLTKFLETADPGSLDGTLKDIEGIRQITGITIKVESHLPSDSLGSPVDPSGDLLSVQSKSEEGPGEMAFSLLFQSPDKIFPSMEANRPLPKPSKETQFTIEPEEVESQVASLSPTANGQESSFPANSFKPFDSQTKDIQIPEHRPSNATDVQQSPQMISEAVKNFVEEMCLRQQQIFEEKMEQRLQEFACMQLVQQQKREETIASDLTALRNDLSQVRVELVEIRRRAEDETRDKEHRFQMILKSVGELERKMSGVTEDLAAKVEDLKRSRLSSNKSDGKGISARTSLNSQGPIKALLSSHNSQNGGAGSNPIFSREDSLPGGSMSERIIRRNLDLPIKQAKDKPEAIVELPTPVWSGSGTPANEATPIEEEQPEEVPRTQRISNGSNSDFHFDKKRLVESDRIEMHWNNEADSPTTPHASEEPNSPLTAKPLSCQIPIWKTKTAGQAFKKPKHSTGDMHSPIKDLSVMEPWKESPTSPAGPVRQPSEIRPKKLPQVNHRRVDTLPLPEINPRLHIADGQLTPKFNPLTERPLKPEAYASHSLSPEKSKKKNSDVPSKILPATSTSQGSDGRSELVKPKVGKADFKKGKVGGPDLNATLPCNASSSQRYVPVSKSMIQTTAIPASKQKILPKGSDTLSNHGTDAKGTPGPVTPKRAKMASFRSPKIELPVGGGLEKASPLLKKS